MEENSINPIKVSVCISVHNTAKYLPRCLDSVCAQTLQSLEIVLVNNGSTDNSEEIMRDYASQHPERKFVIVSQEDRSLAGGRQTGINYATGEYLAFLDADDLVLSTMYEDMLDCAIKNNCDIVEVDTVRDGTVISSPYEGIHSSHAILKDYFVKGGIPSMLWLRLYKHDLFKKQIMPDLYTNNEDMFGLPCLLFEAKTICYLHKPLHIYSTDNENGVMKTTTTDPKLRNKYYNNRVVALKCFPHFVNFAADGFGDFQREFNVYMAEYVFYNFVCYNFHISSYKKKLTDAANSIGSISPWQLKILIKAHISNKYIKCLGLFPVYLFLIGKSIIKETIKNIIK